MNIGITIARKGETFEDITGPEVPFTEQRRAFRKLRVELVGRFDELQLWSSGQGRVKKRSLVAPTTAVEDSGDEAPAETPQPPVEVSPAPEKKKPSNKADNLAKARAAAKAKKSAAPDNLLS